MKGDFSRDSFNPLHRFTRVLQQQGRVTIDADTNEQQAINLHLMRSFMADVIGPHGGPGDGFKLEANAKGFSIMAGHYYVDGWLCENADTVSYHDQPWFKADPAQPWEANQTYLAYLEVWERHVTATTADRLHDIASPDAIREVALDGPDTASRAQTVWQVRLAPFDAGTLKATGKVFDTWAALDAKLFPPNRGLMTAKAAEAPVDTGDPCTVSPRSRYRGIENQLYRVEIRHGGTAANGAAFAWSRENGAVVFPVETFTGRQVKLADVWRDERFALAVGQIVELSDDAAGLRSEPEPLYRIDDYDPDSATVTLDRTPEGTADGLRCLHLRRWDHGDAPGLKNAEVPLVENDWLPLEDGIAIWFSSAGKATQHVYRPGDYWLVPARVTLGDILWPRDGTAERKPLAVAPHGIDRHRAPLAVVTVDQAGNVKIGPDLTRRFKPLAN